MRRTLLLYLGFQCAIQIGGFCHILLSRRHIIVNGESNSFPFSTKEMHGKLSHLRQDYFLFSGTCSLLNEQYEKISGTFYDRSIARRHAIMIPVWSLAGICSWVVQSNPAGAEVKKCTDIDSCREIGERKDEEDLRRNPITRLPSGVQYKTLRPGIGTDVVKEGTVLDLTYSISQASGSYMYSRGFGFEKIKDFDGNREVNDLGLDSLRVQIGDRPPNVPLGIEEALMGMKRGEKRRVTVPPSVGFETSNWQPEPTTRRGKVQISNYKNLLQGNGSTIPAFPAPTIWDIAVERIKS